MTHFLSQPCTCTPVGDVMAGFLLRAILRSTLPIWQVVHSHVCFYACTSACPMQTFVRRMFSKCGNPKLMTFVFMFCWQNHIKHGRREVADRTQIWSKSLSIHVSGILLTNLLLIIIINKKKNHLYRHFSQWKKQPLDVLSIAEHTVHNKKSRGT